MEVLSEQSNLFGRAARTVADLVASIPDEAWDGPGLGEWDVRALVGHTSRSLLTVESYLAQPAEREELSSPETYLATGIAVADPSSIAQRGRDAGAALGPDPAGTFSAIVDRVLPLLTRDDDPLITTIAGGMRLSSYLQTRTFELVVHGLDIADALGIDPPAFDDLVWRAGLELAAHTAVVTDQPAVLLRAMTGRAELPSGFSVV